MITRILAAAAALAISVAPVAGMAHDDPSSETKSCDTWARATGHPGGHEHNDNSDVNLPVGELHATSGHYVLRGEPGYLEVVGGQSYRGPDPDGNDFPGQGGYVQGELDPGSGAPDADFNVAFFGPDADNPPMDPTDVPAWAQGSYAKVCVNVAGNQVEQESREP